MNSQSYLQSISQPFFFISVCSIPRTRPQSGALVNFSSSMQLNSSRKVSGKPANSYPLLFDFSYSAYSIASFMFLEERCIQGSSPFKRNISEQSKLQSSSLRAKAVLELADLLLNLNEPLNRSLSSSGICFPFLMQSVLSSKSAKQILCFILPLPTKKLLGLISPCSKSLLWRYSMRSSSCRPTIRTVLRLSLPPHRCLSESTSSANSYMTRQARPFSQKAYLISGKPCRCGCFNFWYVCIWLWRRVFSFWRQLLRTQTVPSSFLQRWRSLSYPLFMVYTKEYLPFISIAGNLIIISKCLAFASNISTRCTQHRYLEEMVMVWCVLSFYRFSLKRDVLGGLRSLIYLKLMASIYKQIQLFHLQQTVQTRQALS